MQPADGRNPNLFLPYDCRMGVPIKDVSSNNLLIKALINV